MPGHGLPVPPATVLGVGVVLAGAIVWLLGRRMAARTADAVPSWPSPSGSASTS